MSDNWIVAETYPIEGFWQTQIVLRGAEVVATTAGRTEKQSRERAERIVAAEAALVLAQQNLTKCGLTVISHEATVTQQAATIAELHAIVESHWTAQAGYHACGCDGWPECTHTLIAHEMRIAAMKLEKGE
jgi:hypothetical protein